MINKFYDAIDWFMPKAGLDNHEDEFLKREERFKIRLFIGIGIAIMILVSVMAIVRLAIERDHAAVSIIALFSSLY